MAASISLTPLSILVPSLSPKSSQFGVAQKTQFPFLSHPSSFQSLSLEARRLPGPLLGSYNVQVVVEENEPEEKLLGRFRREVFRAGVIQECKRRRYFENKHDKIKRKTREAAKRNRRRRPQFKSMTEDKEMADKKKQEYDLDDDNWDLPEDS